MDTATIRRVRPFALVSPAAEVLEADHATAFALFDNDLVTPALGSILPSITHAAVLTHARKLGFKTHERTISINEFKQADAAFATNSGSRSHAHRMSGQ